MKFVEKLFFLTLVLSLFLVVSSASADEYFAKTEVITIPEGFVATGFAAEVDVDSGIGGVPFCKWGWKIVNTDNSSAYEYRAKPVKQTGPLSELVLCPGKYYVYLDMGANKLVDLKVSYDLVDDSFYRYVHPSRHHGYTVYDFDNEVYMYGSGDCGYFRVKDNEEPYFFVETPAYIRVDDRYESRYFDTPEGYYIFDGREMDPVLFDTDDEVIIVDDGDGQIIIVEEY